MRNQFLARAKLSTQQFPSPPYDAFGRQIATLQDGAGNQPEVTDYVYDLLGNLDQVGLPNGVVSDYDYDNLNRLSSFRNTRTRAPTRCTTPPWATATVEKKRATEK